MAGYTHKENMEFVEALKVSLIVDYWVTKRVLGKNHALLFVFSIDMLPTLNKMGLSAFGTLVVSDEKTLVFELNSAEDLHQFESRALSMIVKLRDAFGFYSSNINADDEKIKVHAQKYLSDIEDFFTNKQSKSIRVPMVSYRDINEKIIYFIHNCESESVIVDAYHDIKLLLNQFKETEYDTSISDYIADIEVESVRKDSSIQGELEEWILRKVEVKLGCDIGMDLNNHTKYLVLTLENGADKLVLKMGGSFSRHIPLIKRQAEQLIDSLVTWHTWNSEESNWSESTWFYRIEGKNP